ncbi:MAG: PleD family two-component system response regulator [Alphaproteobacteria bacterium]|nr:PleD family two-component system response regulator [Alphaproteobacteria bacterium]
MSARVLIVDDLPTNLKVLEAKLLAEYFDVLTAGGGQEALDIAAKELPDIVLLDVMMPEMDGFEACRRLKAEPKTAHIPVVMVTALSDIHDRVTGLEAGADDFLTKPVDDIALLARIKSLVRLKMVVDEWHRREQTCDQLGVLDDDRPLPDEVKTTGKVLVIEKSTLRANKIREVLEEEQNTVVSAATSAEGFSLGMEDEFDLIIVSLQLDGADGLRLCSQYRSHETTRHTPILLICEPEEKEALLKGFELGVNDYLIRPIDGNELKARARTQLRHKHFHDRLRDNYQRSLSLALTDSLTGLHNRRYVTAHLESMIRQSLEKGKSLALLMIDIDFFKKVNDTHGHGVGDEVLRGVAERIKRNFREFDLPARIGGEEFVVVMPDSRLDVAVSVAERLRSKIAETPFVVSADAETVAVTVSIGVALTKASGDSADDLMNRADEALYEAKGSGRDRVVTAPVEEVKQLAAV